MLLVARPDLSTTDTAVLDGPAEPSDAPLAGVVLVAVSEGANEYYYYYSQRRRSAQPTARGRKAQQASTTATPSRFPTTPPTCSPRCPRPPTSPPDASAGGRPAVTAVGRSTRTRRYPGRGAARSQDGMARGRCHRVESLDLGLATWLWVTDPREWPVGSRLVVIPLLLGRHRAALRRRRARKTRFDLAGLIATGLLRSLRRVLLPVQQRADAAMYHNAGSTRGKLPHFDFGVDLKASSRGPEG